MVVSVFLIICFCPHHRPLLLCHCHRDYGVFWGGFSPFILGQLSCFLGELKVPTPIQNIFPVIHYLSQGYLEYNEEVSLQKCSTYGIDDLTKWVGNIRNYSLLACVNVGHNSNVSTIKEYVLIFSWSYPCTFSTNT